MSRNCSISLGDKDIVRDIIIGASAGQIPLNILNGAPLAFLSVVDVALIPLHITIGSPYAIHTSSDQTECWFRNLLLTPESEARPAWWETSRSHSPLGILVSVPRAQGGGDDKSQARVTELLLYASTAVEHGGRPLTPPPSSPMHGGKGAASKATPTLGVYALALSSDLLWSNIVTGPTPPASPIAQDEDSDGLFLPHHFLDEQRFINEPPVRKRKTAADAFDEANDRHKKARRKGGAGVSAAAAVLPESHVPTLHHRRSSSNAQVAPVQTRPPSRSPSLAPSRPVTAVSRRSTLSRVQSAADPPDVPAIEAKNKDIVSRVVMAGMRLYGLSQSKRRKSRAGSAQASPAVDKSFEEADEERKQDEEFKRIYHQVYKGTCFAFRRVFSNQSLQAFPDRIRDVADQLLSVFCADPLAKDENRAFRLDGTLPKA